jgi:N-methylhydantoinase B
LNDYGQIDLAAAATERGCDPITLEIVRGALRATQGEMEALIERTAMSPVIREKKDFYAALFDGEGRLIVGSNLPIFGDAISPILEHYPRATVREGDVYWYNDCYASHGAVSHSPDQVFACPVSYGDEIVAFAQSWAHFNDIGGMRAGSLSPDCEETFREGIIVPPVLIARDGRFNDELFRVFVRNSRFPAMVQGDTRASIAAIRLGERATSRRVVRALRRCADARRFRSAYGSHQGGGAPSVPGVDPAGRLSLRRRHRLRRTGAWPGDLALPPGSRRRPY